MDKIVIIGGNAAGLTAASRARRLDPNLDVTVLEKLPEIAYSTCGLPYMLTNQVQAQHLISYTPETLEKERGIKALCSVQATSIVPGRKRIEAVRTDTGETLSVKFDKLLISTGIRPRVPNIPGIALKNVFTVMNLQDAAQVRNALASVSSVSVVGAGYAGLEFAEALRSLGKEVTIFEQQPQVLQSVDPDIAEILAYELRRLGVQVFTSTAVTALVGEEGRVNGVKTATSLGVIPAQMVLLDIGVEPNVDLAREAGIQIGTTGAIAVDARMETNVPGVYAAGNCAESHCLIRRKPVLSAIGTVAAKQGRVAGENLAGRRTTFLGALGTTVLKVFELGVARTGLSSREAALERIPFVSARIETLDRASYYPGARKVWIKLLADRESRKLIGAQAAGYGDVSKPIDTAAAAISGGLTIDGLSQVDLAYSPPFSSLWNPLLVAAQALMRRMG